MRPMKQDEAGCRREANQSNDENQPEPYWWRASISRLYLFLFFGGIIDHRIWKNLYSSCLWYVPRFTSFSLGSCVDLI